MKKHILLALVASIALIGCGGGGGSDPSSTTAGTGDVNTVGGNPASNQNTISDSGSVDAPYVRGAHARFFLGSVGITTGGVLASHTQTASGAMTQLNTNTLTGATFATQEIAGNAQYAQGRWNYGVGTTSGGSVTMDGTNNVSYHYVAINDLAALPTSGTISCNTGKFTKPSYIGGGTSISSSAFLGTTSGTASINFDGTGAHVTMNLTTVAAGASGTAPLSGDLPGTSSAYIAGSYGSLATGGIVAIGDAGNSAVIIATLYQVKLNNDASYRGVATFICQ